MKTFKALLTDLDGTLIQSEDCICEALDVSFKYLGVHVPQKQQILDMFGLPVEVMLTTLTEVEAEDVETIDRFIAEYKRQYPLKMGAARVIPGAMETLAQLDGYGIPICLITSERRQNAAYILNRTGLDRFVKNVISRDDVTHFKPHPEPLQRAMDLVLVGEQECAYIGEAPFDIQAGLAAGVYTVAVPSGRWPQEKLRECNPDWLIQDIRRLAELPWEKQSVNR